MKKKINALKAYIEALWLYANYAIEAKKFRGKIIVYTLRHRVFRDRTIMIRLFGEVVSSSGTLQELVAVKRFAKNV